MAVKKLKPTKKKVGASPKSSKTKEKRTRGKKPNAAKRSMVPQKKAAHAIANAKPQETESPMEPPVLPIPSATFTF